MFDYRIEGSGAHGSQDLPAELSGASEADVEAVLAQAAAFLGFEDVVIQKVTSVLGGSCIVCTDVVAYASGVPVLIARPSL